MRKKIGIFIFLGLILVIFVQISKQYQQNTENILGYGTIEAREIRVGSKLGGRIEQVHFQEGSILSEKDIILSLDARELQATEKEVRAALESAQAKYEELKAGYRQETIEKARAVVREQEEYLKKLQAGARHEEISAQEARMKTAQAEYDHAERTYRRVVENLQQGAMADQQKDDARRTLEMAKQKLQTETKNYELLKAGTRVEDIAIAGARLNQAQAELKQLVAGPRKEEIDRAEAFIQESSARLHRIQIQLEECKIVAPSHCRLEICDLEPGDILSPGQVAATLLKPDEIWVKIYISGKNLDRVALHQKVKVVAEFSSQRDFRSWFLRQLFSLWEKPQTARIFDGTIVHIASQAEFTPRNVQTTEERGNQVFAVKVNILNQENFLRPGMSVTVEESPTGKQ